MCHWDFYHIISHFFMSSITKINVNLVAPRLYPRLQFCVSNCGNGKMSDDLNTSFDCLKNYSHLHSFKIFKNVSSKK